MPEVRLPLSRAIEDVLIAGERYAVAFMRTNSPSGNELLDTLRKPLEDFQEDFYEAVYRLAGERSKSDGRNPNRPPGL